MSKFLGLGQGTNLLQILLSIDRTRLIALMGGAVRKCLLSCHKIVDHASSFSHKGVGYPTWSGHLSTAVQLLHNGQFCCTTSIRVSIFARLYVYCTKCQPVSIGSSHTFEITWAYAKHVQLCTLIVQPRSSEPAGTSQKRLNKVLSLC